VCATCGRTPDDEAAARLTWVRGLENGRVVWTCERCSREHLRSIEGKLDSSWW
jgi:DNA-directed RNA polymerase subunit RPC12/RpoP